MTAIGDLQVETAEPLSSAIFSSDEPKVRILEL
jgi:hypothetical protein